MPFNKLAVLAAVAGFCNGEGLRALQIRGLPRERIHNGSAIPYEGTPSTSAIFSNSLLGISPSSNIPSPSSTSYVVSGNSSILHGATGTASSPHLSSNGTCGQPTLNVLSASLDWWYTSTVYNTVSTFSIQFNSNDSVTGWTLLPATTTFNLESALGSPAPVAAETTVITQTAYKTPNATTGIGQIPNVIVTPPSPSITIPHCPTAFSEGTPFVYFSNYEVISKTPRAYGDGDLGCAAVTRTSSLATPFAFAYTGSIGNDSNGVGAGMTGDVNPAFLGVVGQSSAVAGSWVAAPTVVIVVQDILIAEAVLAASIEQSQKSLLTPTATLPSLLSPVHPKTTEDHLPSAGTEGHTETTATVLLVPSPAPTKTSNGAQNPKTTSASQPHGGVETVVPFVAHLEHSEITLEIPVNPTKEVVTATFRGETVTATRIPQSGKPTKGNSGGVGSLMSAIVSALKGTPTNALQVLSQAEESLKHHHPTAPPSPQGGGKHGNSGGGAGKTVPVIVVGGTTFTANAKAQFPLGTSKTLTPGGTAVVAGTSLSLLPGGSSVVIDGHTQAVTNSVITPAPALTIAGHVYYANSGSTYVIGGQTLAPGGVVSVHGTFISLGTGLSTIVVNGNTRKIAGPNSPSASITSTPTLTIGGKKFTAINSGPTYVINGETLTPGEKETVTIHGKIYIVSLAPGATILEIETLGPKGEVTATMYETFYQGAIGQATATTTLGAASGSAGKSGPSQSTGPAPNLQNSASSSAMPLRVGAIALGSLVFAIWL